MSMTYTTAHSNAGSLTHCMRPGIKPASSWMLVRFITTEPQRELLVYFFFFFFWQWEGKSCCFKYGDDVRTLPAELKKQAFPELYIYEGRAFWVSRAASSKALRWKHVLDVQGTAKRPQNRGPWRHCIDVAFCSKYSGRHGGCFAYRGVMIWVMF